MELRRCLEECDIISIRKLWKYISPNLPQPSTDQDALISIHIARTQSSLIPFKKKAYSHKWLLERNFPSMLPDDLRPKAERMYPRDVEGVGISINTTSSVLRPALSIIRKSMEDAVQECYNDSKTDVVFVKKRMKEARDRVIKKLLGDRTLCGIQSSLVKERK